ncbi:MAG: hypothetical protein KDE09_14495 [Anaerolineales bacterium]|nr:hypothetical protein [Anaerolineales bacterium]MCB0011634.1 hypothetical protein [Anaerolineales bacterium]MCB0018996.1 hypothetical protein [Anaerolineales bacterium]MCB0029054.1 hypothetical protein [Anaerolineales bacterium]
MAHSHDPTEGIFGQLNGLWQRLPRNIRLNLENNFLPENPLDRPMPGEEVQLEIHIAYYRDLVSHFVLDYFYQVLSIFGIVGLLILGIALLTGITPLLALIPVIGFFALFSYAIYERVEYTQWRLVKTNARLVISLPQHNSWPLVDNIELKGMPNVVDTNWSKNPLWRLFQAVTGARDVHISLVGYQFQEGSARVVGALVIPDVMPEDVYDLKRQIFRAG